MPAARAAAAAGCTLGSVCGMPGAEHQRGEPGQVERSRERGQARRHQGGRHRVIVPDRDIPRPSRARHAPPAARCARARPPHIARRRRPASRASSSDLQRREPHQRQHHRDDPEADHDGRLRPGPSSRNDGAAAPSGIRGARSACTRTPWMMTDTVSSTNSPPTIASTISCFVATATAPSAPAQRQAAGIAHEHRRRWRIVPQEPQPGPDQPGQEHAQLAHARHRMQLQVVGEDPVADQIRDQREHAPPR